MEQRLNYHLKAPKLMQPILALNHAVETCGLERSLLHLIKLRASQINGCSFCVDMHACRVAFKSALPQSVWRTILRTGRFRRDSDDFKEALVARERCFRSKR